MIEALASTLSAWETWAEAFATAEAGVMRGHAGFGTAVLVAAGTFALLA
jgi:hypothetical protein